MARIALARHRDMRCRFSQRILRYIGAAMAGRTLASGAGVAHLRRLEGDVVSVTGIARRRRRDMRGRLAQRIGAVVASRAGPSYHVLMGIAGRLPGCRCMASVTSRCRLNMSERLA